MSSIIDKIKEAGLVGRGGASFPTWQKWAAVLKAREAIEHGDNKTFVVCNVSEGEPGVRKDYHLLNTYPEKVIDGMKLAVDFLGAKKGYIYLNHDYGDLKENLTNLGWGKRIEVFIKPEGVGYIGGEESTTLNVIEGRRAEPRLRPPFPVTSGLWGYPTLVNNAETFYNVSLVNSGAYQKMRFYSINGDVPNGAVFEFPDDFTIERVLKESHNYPEFPFFVQIGGNGSGEVLNDRQLQRPVSGAGSIAVYRVGGKTPHGMIKGWIGFFFKESCGQCTSCREGTYRLAEILESAEPDWLMFFALLENLRETAFCGLGAVVASPVFSYITNVLDKHADNMDEKVIVAAFNKFQSAKNV